MEIEIESVQTKNLDHFGLIASVCDELRISEQIDDILGPIDPRKKISFGQAVKLMIINGLGFANHRLYMSKLFYRDKPLKLLFGENVQLENINDYVIGKTLEKIGRHGVTEIFSSLALNIGNQTGLLGKTAHLDTTSVNVEGEYEKCESDDLVRAVKLTHGHSKDHRPDLKQLVLSLTVTGPASMPFWLEVLDGNSSDKKNMPDTIERIRAFRKQLETNSELIWVCDSAAYSKFGILSKAKDWICRVPENIKETRTILERFDSEIDWIDYKDGYKVSEFESEYGNCAQRWLLVYSDQAYHRERKTFYRNLSKSEEKLKKDIWHLENKSFSSKEEAEKEAKNLNRKYKHHIITIKEIKTTKHFSSIGRPSKDNEPEKLSYNIFCSFIEDKDAIEISMNKKGRFIIATSILDKNRLSDFGILDEYKNQQKVERGFRFLKDPWFMADDIYLKNDDRIAALMMIMTLCLMVYNIAQFRLRECLKKQNETLPNQLNKQVQNVTLRWVFQMMSGISIATIKLSNGQSIEKKCKIDPIQQKIVCLFGEKACIIYGVKQE